MPTCILRGFEIAVTHTSTKLHGGYEQCTRRKTYVSFLATTTSTSSVLSYYFLYTTSIPTDKRLKRVEPLSDQVPSYGRHNQTSRQHRRHWQPSWSGKKRCKPGGLLAVSCPKRFEKKCIAVGASRRVLARLARPARSPSFPMEYQFL